MAETVKVDLVSVGTEKTAKSVDSLKKQIKDLRLEIEKTEEGSAEWQEKMNELGNLIHKQSELQAEAKRSMNDFGMTMTNINGAAAGLVGGISAVTSTLSLLGIDINKDDVGMIKMMTALQGLAQSFTQMDSGIKSVRGLMTALDGALTRVLAKTAATTADTVSETANTAATETNTAATIANAAAKGQATGASTANAAATAAEGAAAAGAGKKLGTLASVFPKLIKVIKNFKVSLGVAGIALTALSIIITKIVKQHQEEKEAMEKSIETENNMRNSVNEVMVSYSNLKASYEAVGDSYEAKSQWLKDHNSELQKLDKNIDSVNDADKVFITQSDEYVAALTKRVTAEFQVNEAIAEQKSNLEKLNQIRSTLNNVKWINDDGTLNWNKKVKIGDIKKTVSEWYAEINRLQNRNTALINSVVKGEQAIASATADMKKTTGTFSSGGGGVKTDWIGKLNQNLSTTKSIYESLQNILTKLKNDINASFGNEDTFMRKFYNSVTDALETTMVDIDSLMGEGYKKLQDMYQETVEVMDDGMLIYRQKTEKDTETLFKESFEKAFEKIDFKDGTANVFQNILDEFSHQIPSFQKRLQESIDKLFSDNFTLTKVNAANLFDDEGYLKLMEDLRSAFDSVKAKQIELNALNQKSSSKLTSADKKRISQLEKELKTEQKKYDLLKAQADVVDKTYQSFLEGRKAQQALMMSYQELVNLATDFAEQQDAADKYFKRLTTGISQYGKDWNKTIADFNKSQADYTLQIEQSQRLIEQYKLEYNAYDTNTQRKIELAKLLMQENNNLRNTINASNLAVYEYHTQLLDKEYEKIDNTYSKMNEDAKNKWKGITLGTEDYNTARDAAQMEIAAMAEKMRRLQEYRDQDIINEEEYQARRYYLQQEMAEKEQALAKANSDRKLKIHETYYSAYESINSSITSLLSELQSGYDQDSKQYKDLAVANAITDTLSGTLSAFMSGVKSGIPAPANLILASALAATTFATGLASIQNIKSGTLSDTTSSANTSTSAYETLAYETGADIYGAVSDQRVYVTEHDITSAQRRVSVAEAEAAF